MESQREEQFLSELETQVNFAIFSIEQINIYLNNLSNYEMLKFITKDNEDYFWYYAQNLIVYSGNISKLLWGVYPMKITKEKRERRMKERLAFRRKLDIAKSPILEHRDLRNALEHIDEKLEDFTVELQAIILNKNIGPVKGMISIGDNDLDISKVKNLRHYDQITKTYYFYGNSANLEELYKEIKSIDEKITNYKRINSNFY